MTKDDRVKLLEAKVTIVALLGTEPSGNLSLDELRVLMILVRDPEVEQTRKIITEHHLGNK